MATLAVLVGNTKAQSPANSLPDAPRLPSSASAPRSIASSAVDLPLPQLAFAETAPALPDQHGPRRWWPRAAFGSIATPQTADTGRYQWRGLIWQSVEFNVIENGFRVSSDHVMRDTLAHRPFWHNYGVSMNQFNMRRWNDGDTFIVNYIGHSLHGSVAAMIEIQNSPTDRRLQWGDPGYTKSRFKGFLWATVFSTHSEISPAGEPGIGNEGGFTYGKDCLYKCTAANFHPGDKYTNDTGWVDFIATPTTGMLWVVTEDVIDKYLTGPLVRKHPGRAWPLVVRGSLNPSRSFSNALRWREPWYRDWDEPISQPTRVYWYPPEEEAAYRALPRVQISPFYSGLTIAANTPTCFNCRETAIGGGLQTTVKLRGWLGLDTALSYHPGASALPSDRAGGNLFYGVFGLSATRQWRYYAVHAAIRPGLVRYSRAYLTSPQLFPVLSWPPRIATHGGDADSLPVPGVIDASGLPDEPALGAIHHFVWDFNLGLDYRLNKHLAFRVGLDDPIVRYRTDKVDAPGLGKPPYLSWLSKQQFINRGNFNLQLGPVVSF